MFTLSLSRITVIYTYTHTHIYLHTYIFTMVYVCVNNSWWCNESNLIRRADTFKDSKLTVKIDIQYIRIKKFFNTRKSGLILCGLTKPTACSIKLQYLPSSINLNDLIILLTKTLSQPFCYPE